jgi:predicted peptidase
MSKALHLVVALVTASLLFSCKKDYTSLLLKKDTVEREPPVLKGFTQNIGSNVGGYFAGLPAHYSEGNKRYPLLLYIHGLGHFGNGEAELPLLLSDGIPALLDTKAFPPNVQVNGRYHSFIVIAPQFKTYMSMADVQGVIDFAKTHYRIDESRIYIAGFSLGAQVTADFAAENAGAITAIVPMAGASNYDVSNKCKKIAGGNLPVWAFHNAEDELIPVSETFNFIALINSYRPMVKPRLTIFPTSSALLKHDAWTKATDPNYRENGMNIYEWMLQFTR